MASRVIILCGLMGSGKSTIGALLARDRGIPFIDTDARVEAAAGASISEIFARDGEAVFRRQERNVVAAVVREVATLDGAVVATGGGAIVDAANRAALESLGTLILLDAPAEVLAARTAHAGVRPLLFGAATPASVADRLRQLRADRAPVYDSLSYRFDTSARTPEQTIVDIIETLDGDGTQTNLRVDTRPVPGVTPAPDNTRLCRVIARRGVIGATGPWLQRLGLSNARVISPQGVARHYLTPLTASLDAAGISHAHIRVEDGDAAKTFAQAGELLEALAQSGATRRTAVITLGGGVTGDIGGFAAATYMRGVPWINVPTTLLAQVDASIGGKTGVNSAVAKNTIGAMHQPLLVLSDVDTMATLPHAERANGMAEVIKTAMIGDAALLETLDAARKSGAPFDTPDLLTQSVSACVRIKGRIVEADPYERDLRRVLNLGHTLGHAVEAAAGYGAVRHGEAVAIGLVAALRVAVARGLADAAYAERVTQLLKWASLPTTPPASLSRDAMRNALLLDKKRTGAMLTFVLPIAPGNVRIVDDVSADELLELLDI